MKTFKEFTQPAEESTASSKGFPTFEEAMAEEKAGKGCMSENMMEMMTEMYEGMCEEMKACHDDETERTAESYMSEAAHRMNEMMEGLKGHCKECMIKKG